MNKGEDFAQIQVKLITSLLVALLPIGLVLALIVEYRRVGIFDPFSPFLLTIFGGLTIVVLIYFFSPTSNYKVIFLGTFAFAAVMIISTSQLIEPRQAHFPLYYLVLPVLLSTIFLSAKHVGFASFATVAIAIIVAFTFPEVPFVSSFLGPISFLLLNLVALVLATRYREILEEIYRRNLALKEAMQVKRAEELFQLHQTSLAMTQEPRLKDALQTIVDKATSLLGLKNGEVLLVRNEQLVSIATTIDSPWDSKSVRPVPFGQGLSGSVAASRTSISVPNYATWHGRNNHKLFNQVRRAVGVPLLYQGEILGVIIIFDLEQMGDFLEDEIRLLEMFASQAAIVIQNVRWRESLQRAKDTLEEEVTTQTSDLREVRDRLLQLDRIRAKMMDDISHELRTPITNLILYADLMEKGAKEKQGAYLSVIKRESNYLSELVEGILRLGHLDVTNDSVLSEGIKLNQLIVPVVNEMMSQAKGGDLKLRFEPAPLLPTVTGNENQLRELVSSLVRNSLLYTEHGEVSLKTAVSEGGQFVEFIIQDTGIGIPQEEQQKVFDRLYRGTAVAQRNIRGVGLGLALVKDIVDLHRGRIELNSEVGQGTVVKILLPAD